MRTQARDLDMTQSSTNDTHANQVKQERYSFNGNQTIAQMMGGNAAEFFRIFDDHLYVATLGGDGQMTAISTKLARDFNLSDPVVHLLSDFVTPDGRQANHMDDVWREVERNGLWRGDLRHQAHSGVSSWFSATIIPCPGNWGKHCRHVVFFTDVTARVENETALRESKNDLRALASHMDFSQECDRKRIAREIHDELGQHLLALKMDLFGLQRAPRVQPRIARDSADLMRSVDETMLHVKRIINDLRPIALDAGFAEAVRICAGSFTRRHKVPCKLCLSDLPTELNEVAATTLYRILQESLVNIGRHARANQVCISLLCSRGAISIEIDDDGVGMAPGHHNRRKTFGLLGMKERVEMLGGTLAIISQIGTGTKVVASMPHK